MTESVIDEAISSLLKKISPNPKLIDWLQESNSEFMRDADSSSKDMVKDWQRGVDQAIRRRSRLLELRIADEITAEDFGSMNAALKSEIDDLSEKIRRHNEALVNAPLTVHNLAQFLRSAHRTFNCGTAQTKREIASCLSDKAVLSKGRLDIELHPLLKPLETFEPLPEASDMVHFNPFMPLSPVWQGWMDATRTLVTEGGHTFPRLECLQSDSGPSIAEQYKSSPAVLGGVD